MRALAFFVFDTTGYKSVRGKDGRDIYSIYPKQFARIELKLD